MKKTLLFTYFLIVAVLVPSSVRAQEAIVGFGESYQIDGDNIKSGSLVCFKESKYGLCNEEYSIEMVGVVNDDTAIVLKNTEITNSHLVSDSGKAYVRVLNVDGEIKTGDYLTSSSVPGVAKKATHNGYVIGTALEDYLE